MFKAPALFVTVAVPLLLTVPSIVKPPAPVFSISKPLEVAIFPLSPTFKPPAPLFVNVPLPPVVTFPVIFIPSTPLS
ncbi:unknown [Fusobacterium sp. CAG:815]|nr:unknown [Fusobacterium sp. CAG:815]